MAEQERQVQSKCLNMFAGRRGRQKQVGALSAAGDGAAWAWSCCVSRGPWGRAVRARRTSHVASRKSQVARRAGGEWVVVSSQ
jgi:hypothetical protein